MKTNSFFYIYLQCHTQQEIAEEIGLTQKQISIKIEEIEQKYKEIYQNPDSENGIKYQFLQQKIKELYQFQPFLYNIWNVQFVEQGGIKNKLHRTNDDGDDDGNDSGDDIITTAW